MNRGTAESNFLRVALHDLRIHPQAIAPLQAFVRLPRVAAARQKLMSFTGVFPPIVVQRGHGTEPHQVIGELASYVQASWLELHGNPRLIEVVCVERTRREIEDQLDLELLRALDQGRYRSEADAFEGLCEALSERTHYKLFGRARPSARAKALISGLPEEDFLHRPSPVAALRIWDKICKSSLPARSNGRPS